MLKKTPAGPLNAYRNSIKKSRQKANRIHGITKAHLPNPDVIIYIYSITKAHLPNLLLAHHVVRRPVLWLQSGSQDLAVGHEGLGRGGREATPRAGAD